MLKPKHLGRVFDHVFILGNSEEAGKTKSLLLSSKRNLKLV